MTKYHELPRCFRETQAVLESDGHAMYGYIDIILSSLTKNGFQIENRGRPFQREHYPGLTMTKTIESPTGKTYILRIETGIDLYEMVFLEESFGIIRLTYARAEEQPRHTCDPRNWRPKSYRKCASLRMFRHPYPLEGFEKVFSQFVHSGILEAKKKELTNNQEDWTDVIYLLDDAWIV